MNSLYQQYSENKNNKPLYQIKHIEQYIYIYNIKFEFNLVYGFQKNQFPKSN